MDEEDFLAAVEADNAGTPEPDEGKDEGKPAAEPREGEAAKQPEAPAEPKAEPNRDETGKFAPKEPEAPKPEAPKAPEPGYVPLAAVLDERDRRTAAEARLRQIEMAQQQRQAPPVQIPDPLDDPEGFAQYQQATLQQAVFNSTLNMSEEFARQQHGNELVDAAQQWAQQQFAANPSLYAEFAQQRNPYGFIVQHYKRQQLMSQLGDDPKEIEDYLAWKQAKTQVQQQPAAPAAPPNSPAIPPPSLASAPSAGSVLTEPVQSDEDIFEETFKRN